MLDTSWQEIKKTYSITKFLGKGTYGEVYKAKHRATNEVFAIKKIKFDIEN
jgi:serine/threonine protein kinase